jgi:hypothetical protein
MLTNAKNIQAHFVGIRYPIKQLINDLRVIIVTLGGGRKTIYPYFH